MKPRVREVIVVEGRYDRNTLLQAVDAAVVEVGGFALFNDTSLTLGGGQSRFAADSPIRGTYETNFSASLGISPGLVAFATSNVAIEVNVGVMGLSYTRTRQVLNQVTVGKRTSSLMNFKVNILSIGLGISLYL